MIQLILRVNEPFQMEQRSPLRAGPWEEPTSLPESTKKKVTSLTHCCPVISASGCYKSRVLNEKGFLKISIVLGWPRSSYGKTQLDFLANSILY